MNPAPLRPAQNALVILAAFLVAGSLFPWAPPFRLACAGGVALVMLVLLAARLRAHGGAGAAGDRATQLRIDRIRAERDARMRPRR